MDLIKSRVLGSKQIENQLSGLTVYYIIKCVINKVLFTKGLKFNQPSLIVNI